MKKLKLELDSLDVRSFVTETPAEGRGTVLARGITPQEYDRTIQLTFPQQTDTGVTSLTYPDTWGTGPCTTAPSSDFPCYTVGEQTVN